MTRQIFDHNMSENFRRSRKLMIITFILHLLGAPMICWTVISGITSKGISPVSELNGYVAGGSLEVAIILGVVATCAASLMGLGFVQSSFRYLINKDTVDMYYGLPLSKKQRFMSDFFSGLAGFILPYIAAEIITLISLLAGHIICDGKAFILAEKYRMSDLMSKPWECTVFSDYSPVIIKGILAGLVLLILLYTVSVLLVSCCGKKDDALIFTAVGIFLSPIAVAFIVNRMTDRYVTISSDVLAMNAVTGVSPVGSALSFVFKIIPDFNTSDYYYDFQSMAVNELSSWFVINAVVILAAFFAAYLINLKRMPEETGKPFVFRPAFYLFALLMTAFCVSLHNIDTGNNNTVPVVVISFLLYMAFSMIINRGFRNIGHSIAGYAVSAVLSFGLFAVSDATGCFSVAYSVPSDSSVAYIYLSGNGQQCSWSSYNIAKISDPAIISTVTKLNRNCCLIDRSQIEDDVQYVDASMIDVIYHLKSGRNVLRTITFYNDGNSDYDALLTCDDMKKSRAEAVKLGVLNSYEEAISDPFAEERGNMVNTITAREVDGNDIFDADKEIKTYHVDEKFYERFADCLYNDIISETAEDYFDYSFVSRISIFDWHQFLIKPTYTETIALLEEYGV